jgi:putative component of membrane protein insertase Oxa1/YidC/SpoIIIJ protein YidD
MRMRLPYALLLVLLMQHSARAAGPNWIGFNPSPGPAPRDTSLRAISPGQILAKPLFHLYQKELATSKGQTCPMVPSCSEYGRLAVIRYGFVTGVLMSADRIHRCGHDLRYYPLIASGNTLRYRDLP